LDFGILGACESAIAQEDQQRSPRPANRS